MTDTSLLQDFIAETGEHLEVTERNLLHLEQQPDDTAALNEIFRSVHTIKGSSEYLGMERIAELSHRLESLLDLLRRGERAVDGAVIDLLISGNDRIGQLVGELDQHQAEQSAIDDLLSRIEGYTAPTGTDAQGQVDGEGGQLEDEVDEELFGIFIEQLKDGLESIEQDIRQLVSGEDARTVFERCSEQLSTLRSSANYMGYDELKALYDRWSETLAVLNAGDALDIDAVVEEAIVSNFKSIQAMFPKVGALAPLVEAVQSLKGAAAPAEATEATEAEEPPAAAQAGPGAPPSDEAGQPLETEPFADQGLFQDFIAETGEHLEATERNLLHLEQQPDDTAALNEIFRSVHTIKGSSEYLGMERIAELSHRLESLLDLLRRGERAVDGAVIDLLISGNDRIGQLVGELDQHQAEQSAIDDLLSRIEGYTAPTGTDAQGQVDGEGGQLEDEVDEELFGIFIEQLKDGLESIEQDIRQLVSGEDARTVFERCSEQLSTLRSSANYMGYDELKALYDRWSETLAVLNAGDALDIDAVVEEAIVSNFKSIQAMFPKVGALAPLVEAVQSLKGAAAPAEATEATEAEEPPAAAQAGPGAPPSDEAGQPLETELFADQELLQDFITETGEHLEDAGRSLLQLEQQPDDTGVLNEIFRSVHTIKGSSEYLGMERIAELSHRLESLLDLLRRGEQAVDGAVIDLLISGNDRIATLMNELEQHHREESTIDDLISRLDQIEQTRGTGAGAAQEQGSASEKRQFAKTQYGEEYDLELFSIFMTQLKQGLQFLTTETDQLIGDSLPLPLLQRCEQRLSRLCSSANYMEYDELKQFYRQWQDEIRDMAQQIANGETVDVASFREGTMAANIARVKEFFPDFDGVPTAGAADGTEAAAPVPPVAEPLSPDEVSPEMVFAMASTPELVTLDDIADDSEIVEAELDDAGPSDDDLLNKLASAFDERLGIHADAQITAYSDDIENDLLSGAGTADDEPPFHPEDDVDDHQSGLLEQWGTGGNAAEVRSTETPDGGPSTDSQLPDAVPSTPTRMPPAPPAGDDVAEPRGRYNVGRRQTDKFRERMLKQSIRVDAAKIDALMNQVGELVVSRSGFNQLFADMRELQLTLKQSQKLDSPEMNLIKAIAGRLNEATASLGRVTADLQENVMKVRMLPIAQLFSRYPRLVHDLVRNTPKKVNLEIYGEETELDKMVIEQIADPLVHIIRNSVDHGIEDVSERKQKGKQESGTLRLEAYHESNFVVIEISDDGRGIDPSQIKMLALDKGFATEAEVEEMNEDELMTLIMRPGFSTAREVTHTSGRGVGMDVVKDNIEKLNGTIDIASTIGEGVRIRIRIPLTLAIIPALLVRVQEEIFTIPLAAVDETIRVQDADISTIEGLEVCYLRENPVPLIRLDQTFGMASASVDRGEYFVVIVNTGARQIGFIVDELKGRQEVVIKPLEDYLQEKSGFSGATILGDGSISLILDVFELVLLSLDKHAARAQAAV
jgi:two-component system chemotaxis sensor kinase CheA